jgi:hypothetical protein
LPFYIKLPINIIESLTTIQRALFFFCISKKNNLYYQTSTPRLYNLKYNPDYIIYKLKQTVNLRRVWIGVTLLKPRSVMAVAGRGSLRPCLWWMDCVGCRAASLRTLLANQKHQGIALTLLVISCAPKLTCVHYHG